MSIMATKEGHQNPMSTTSRPEQTNPPSPTSAGEHQNTLSTAPGDLVSHTLRPTTLPLSPSHDLRDPISTPSSQVDETTILLQYREPEVFGHPMYAANDDSLLLPELPRLSIVSDLDEDNTSGPDDSPTQNRPLAKVPKPPLNSLMKKRKEKFPVLQITDMGDETENFMDNQMSAESRLTPVSPSMPLEEQINSNILDAIPTPHKIQIRATCQPTTQIRSSRFRSTSSQLRRAAANLNHNAPLLTLAPADEQKPRRNGNDPDIRLYHLIQTGRDKPIKLISYDVLARMVTASWSASEVAGQTLQNTCESMRSITADGLSATDVSRSSRWPAPFRGLQRQRRPAAGAVRCCRNLVLGARLPWRSLVRDQHPPCRLPKATWTRRNPLPSLQHHVA